MAIVYNTSVVRSGLVLYLDAANPKSYPGSGTTWTDLSGFSNTGTLINGLTFNSSNNGSLSFDGANDYVNVSSSVSLPYSSSPRTVTIWFYTNTTTWQDNINNLFFYGSRNTGQAVGIDFGTFPNMEVYTWGGVDRDLTFATGFDQVGWKNIALTYNGANSILIYENGKPTQTLTLSAPCNTATSDINLGALVSSSWYFDGRISIFGMYNRALDLSEIQQNFNAARGRYNI